MTEQDKITIFDVLIKPFLYSDILTSDHEEDNLFALAIRQLLNSSLLAQLDTLFEKWRNRPIPPEKLQQVAEALKAASSQPKNPAA